MAKARLHIRWGFLLQLLLVQLIPLSVSQAGPIQLELKDGMLANAEYRAGQPSLPAVLILHGFLTTHTFSTVQTLVEGLSEAGYTVLAPTLTLNISDRRKGLDCEAIHTHTVAGDVLEIDAWVAWLEKQGHRNIAMVGHSTGSLLIAQYLNDHPSKRVSVAVLTAPGYFAGRTQSPEDEAGDIAKARQLLAQNDDRLQQFSLSYCHGTYTATADSYLSYIVWGADRLTAAVAAVRIPAVVLLPGADSRFGRELQEKLTRTAVVTRVIPGAEHFFASPYEFEFVDEVLRVLEERGGDNVLQ